MLKTQLAFQVNLRNASVWWIFRVFQDVLQLEDRQLGTELQMKDFKYAESWDPPVENLKLGST